MKKNCSQCQLINDDDARFCKGCGYAFQDQEDIPKAIILKVRPHSEVKTMVGYRWRDSGSRETALFLLKYLGGIEDRDGTSLEPGFDAQLKVFRLGLIVEIHSGFKSYYTGLAYDEIVYISFKSGEDIQESGSVVGGAILGGLLLGPIGAIVGGMAEAGSKTVKPTLLVIKHKSKDNNEGMVVFAVKSGQKKTIHKYIEKHLYKYYRPS
jgi:hypothetical protein